MSDHPSVYSCEKPIARKHHKCCECRRPIFPGQQYELFKGLYDGLWSRFKTCQRCVRVRDLLIKKYKLRHDENPPFGYLFSDIRDMIMDRRRARKDRMRLQKNVVVV